MKTEEIAEKLVAWCSKGDYNSCYEQLYSPNTVSMEPEGVPHAVSQGMEAIAEKGKWWQDTFEVHSMNISQPTVADDWFSVRFEMDTTHRPSGQRSKSSEIAVYQVADGKIVKEQFFYNTPG